MQNARQQAGHFKIFPDEVKSDFDLYIYTTGQFELHQCVYGLGTGRMNIYQTLVGAKLKLLP
jgi:hypothetical protein